MKEAIRAIEEEFPEQSRPESFVEAHRNAERTEAFADFFQLMLDTGNPKELLDSDARFSVTFKLSLWERIKVLVTGRYDALIGPLLTEAVGFGICWQHYDILETLKSGAKNEEADSE